MDFDEANHEGGDFADFVADTSEQSSRLAYALTGDTELSARVETQAYADVGRRWTDLDAAEARRMLREQLWHHARRADPDPEALTAVADSGWPSVGLALDEIDEQAARGRARRSLLTAGVGVGAAAALGVVGWQLVTGLGDGGRAPTAHTPYGDLQIVATRLVHGDPTGTVRVDLLQGLGPQYLACFHRDVLLGLTRLDGNQILRFVDPTSVEAMLQVVIITPVTWLHLHGSHADNVATPVQVGRWSVGLTRTTPSNVYAAVVGGQQDGTLIVWPESRGRGVRFRRQPSIWAYLVDGRLGVREQGAKREGRRHQDNPDVWRVPLQDGGMVFSLDGAQTEVAITGGQADRVELRRRSSTTSFVLRPALTGRAGPTLTWRDWRGRRQQVPLGETP